MSSKSLGEFPSNLKTKFGEVFDALMRPQQESLSILIPSRELISPFSFSSISISLLTIENLFSSETDIFISGVDKF